MRAAVADVVTSLADAFAPGVKGQLAIELDVGAAEADPLAVDAREIGLAADAGAEAAVQGVVPDVEFPRVGGVDGGDEIDGWNLFAVRSLDGVGDVHDVLVGADPIVGRDLVVGEFVARDAEPPARVGRPHHRALLLGPAQGVETEGGPVVLGLATGVNLVLEAQEAEVSGTVRAKAGDLDVVAQEVGILRYLVVLPGEKLLLVVETRSPGQVAADLEVFTKAVAHHVRGVHPFAGVGVMRAPGGVNVVIAGPPAERRGVDPAGDVKGEFSRILGDRDAEGARNAFGAAIALYQVGAGR